MDQSKPDSIPQLDAMRMGVDFRLRISVKNFSVSIRPLAVMETVQIAGEVQMELAKLPEAYRNRLTEHTLIAKKTICLATTSNVGSNDPELTEYILDRCTEEELQFLYKQYVDAVQRTNPAMEEMSSEQLEALIEDVKKNNSRLIELSRWQLLKLLDSFLTSDA